MTGITAEKSYKLIDVDEWLECRTYKDELEAVI